MGRPIDKSLYKTKGERVQECVALWKKLTKDLAIPPGADGMGAIKEEIDTFIHTGDQWSGEIEIPMIRRKAVVMLTNKRIRPVTITLKCEQESSTSTENT